MQDQTSSKMPNPAVLRFQGLDQEAMMAQQMRNIEAVRRMANLILDSTEAITECQAVFFKTRADAMKSAVEPGKEGTDPNAIIERQMEICRQTFDALVAHASDLTEVGSKCCTSLMQEVAATVADKPAGESGKTKKARSADADAKTRADKT